MARCTRAFVRQVLTFGSWDDSTTTAMMRRWMPQAVRTTSTGRASGTGRGFQFCRNLQDRRQVACPPWLKTQTSLFEKLATIRAYTGSVGTVDCNQQTVEGSTLNPGPCTMGDKAMAVAIICKCGKKLKISPDHAGKRGKCPACGNVFTIPVAPVESNVSPSLRQTEPLLIAPQERSSPSTTTNASLAPSSRRFQPWILIGTTTGMVMAALILGLILFGKSGDNDGTTVAASSTVDNSKSVESPQDTAPITVAAQSPIGVTELRRGTSKQDVTARVEKLEDALGSIVLTYVPQAKDTKLANNERLCLVVLVSASQRSLSWEDTQVGYGIVSGDPVTGETTSYSLIGSSNGYHAYLHMFHDEVGDKIKHGLPYRIALRAIQKRGSFSLAQLVPLKPFTPLTKVSAAIGVFDKNDGNYPLLRLVTPVTCLEFNSETLGIERSYAESPPVSMDKDSITTASPSSSAIQGGVDIRIDDVKSLLESLGGVTQVSSRFSVATDPIFKTSDMAGERAKKTFQDLGLAKGIVQVRQEMPKGAYHLQFMVSRPCDWNRLHTLGTPNGTRQGILPNPNGLPHNCTWYDYDWISFANLGTKVVAFELHGVDDAEAAANVARAAE
jgi:hypothetical protein